MKAIDATRILLNRSKLTNKVRKQCRRARETSMQSATPIYAEKEEGQPTEYFSSKPSEKTDEQRLALKLRRATLLQLHKWALRNEVRNAACRGVAARIDGETKRKSQFAMLAVQHEKYGNACLDEINRRGKKARSIFPDDL